MPPPPAAHHPRTRIAAAGRPFEDRGCAGCAQLPLLAALRRSGLVVEGGLGCDPAAPAAAAAPALPLRTAIVRGAGAPEHAAALAASRAGRALLVVADRGDLTRGEALATALAAAGVPARAVRPDRAREIDDGACLALGCVALSDDGGDAVRVEAERCGGCGLCAPLCRGRALVPAGDR